MLYETWAIQSRGVSTFLKDFLTAEVGKRGQKSRQMIFFSRLFYCCCSADGPRIPASYLLVTIAVVKKEVWIWVKVKKWGKKTYKKEIITGTGYPETLELEIIKKHQDTVLDNLLQVVMVEQGIGPGDFPSNLNHSTVL